MLIPPGFVNLQYVFLRTGDNEGMLTSIGASWDGSTPYLDIVNGAMEAWDDSTMSSNTTDSTTLTKVIGRFGTIGEGDFIVESSLLPTEGGSTAEPCPNNCSMLVKKLTALGGRANRGRMFYPEVRKDHVNGAGLMDSSWVGTVQDDVEDWMAKLTTVTGIDALYLFHSDEEAAPTAITNLVVQAKIATQRRRMRP